MVVVQGEARASTREPEKSFWHPPACVTDFGSSDWTVCQAQGFTIDPSFHQFQKTPSESTSCPQQHSKR